MEWDHARDVVNDQEHHFTPTSARKKHMRCSRNGMVITRSQSDE
jgi:hypothetical protein